MSDTEAKYFVQSFIRFLHKQIAERNFSEDIVESLEVASQCLETAYNLPVVTDHSESPSVVGASGETAVSDSSTPNERHPMSHIDVYELFLNACTVDPARKVEAEAIKNDGNRLMREEKYTEALKAYNRYIK